MRKFFIGLLLTIVGITALLFIPSKQPPAPMPWEVKIMADGNTQVFGIHLGNTTYREAEIKLRQYGKTAIFTQEGKPAAVEAYFESINLGGLSAKLILNLAVDQSQIPAMLSHAMEARIQASGSRRYQLNNEDKARIVDAPITAITYIPSVKLDADMLRYRFGDPAQITHDPDNNSTKIWVYPAINLTIRINPQQKTLLEYQSKTGH